MDELDHYGDQVLFLMRMVGDTLNQQLYRELRPLAVNRAQLGALSQLGLAAPESLSSAELSSRAGVTSQSMSIAIASLVERGLVDRRPNPHHGRILDVHITAAGLDLLRQVQVVAQRVEARAVAALTDTQQRELRSILRTMMDDLGLPLPEPS